MARPVSIPFSSGHGGKGPAIFINGARGAQFLSLFHQVMGVKREIARTWLRETGFLSLFHQVMGVKPQLGKTNFSANNCFYPFFIRSWG